MRISGIEPSSVILSQRKWLQKLKNNTPKVPKEAKAKRVGEIYSDQDPYERLEGIFYLVGLWKKVIRVLNLVELYKENFTLLFHS